MLLNDLPAAIRRLRAVSARYLPQVILCGLFSLTILNAQSGLGSMTGAVTDAQGAVIPGAKVKATNLQTQVSSEGATSSDGLYNMTALVPGPYRVEVRKEGFETSVVDPVTVSSSQTVTVDLRLRVGSATTTISVVAQAELLNSTTPAVTTTVEHQLVEDLPYMERSSISSALLVAGVRGDPTTAGGVSSENPVLFTGYVTPASDISIGGSWPGRSSLMVDGSDITQASLPRAGISVSGDNVQETTVIVAGIPAEYGRTEGGLIIQTTKSGTNKFHGGVSWRHTDPSVMAYPLGGTLPAELHMNFFGMRGGGPVIVPKLYNGRNRTFFWASYEPGRVANATSGQDRLPTQAELAGDFSNSYSLINTTILANSGAAAALAAPRTGALYYQYPLNAAGFPNGPQYTSASQYVPIPNDNVSAQLNANPVAKYLLANFPSPQNPGPYISFLLPGGLWLNNGNNASYTRGMFDVDNRYSFRIDHAIGQNDRVFVRFTDQPLTSKRYLGISPSSPLNASPNDQAWSQDLAINETHIISPSMVNELRLMYMRDRQWRQEIGPALNQDWGASLGMLASVTGVGFPSLSFGYSINPGYSSGADRQVDETYQFSDDLSWTLGKHSIKMGAGLRRLQSNQNDLSGLYGGAYSFSAGQTNNGSSGGNALASLDLGLISSFTNTPVGVPAYYRWHYYYGFAQDDFKILPNLTLNVGLRYEVETPRIEKYNNQGTFIPSITGTLNGLPTTGAYCFSGACGLPTSLWPTNYMGFEPRVGVAWTPLHRMTVRASYDIVRVPLSGYGIVPVPDFNVPSYSIGGLSGGVIPNQPVDFITNPIAPLTSALSALQGSRGPFFTVQGVTVPFVDQSNAVPYAQQWVTTVQYQIAPKTMVQVSYNGLRATHLIGGYSPTLNFPNLSTVQQMIAAQTSFTTTVPNTYGITQQGKAITESVMQRLLPYQGFFNQSLNELYNRAGTSIYHALYLSATHRYQFGLSLVGSFTWDKSMDDMGVSPSEVGQQNYIFGAANVQVPWNLRLDKAVSSFDVPAKLTVGYTYELPIGRNKLLKTGIRAIDAVFGGWTTSGMFNMQSGQPFTPVLGGAGYWVSVGGGTALPTGVNLLPNVVPGQPCINPDWRQNPFGALYLNPAMFTMPGSLNAPALGDAPRTMTNCRGPRVTTFNASLRKRFALPHAEKAYAEIGINAINAFNHPVFYFPGYSSGANSVYSSFNTTSLTNPAVPPFTLATGFGFLAAGNTEPMSRVVQLSLRVSW